MEQQRNSDIKLQIPQIVPFLAETVRATNGQLSEGIFRVPGDADAVTDLVSFTLRSPCINIHVSCF